MEPEDVLRKLVIGGKVNDVKDLVRGLTKGNPEGGKEALDEIRGQVIDHLMAVAHGPNGEGRFAAARFGKEVDKLSDKLKVLFTPDEMKQLANIRMVGDAAFSEPAFSAINHSNSGIYNVHNHGGMGAFFRGLPERLRGANEAVEVR